MSNPYEPAPKRARKVYGVETRTLDALDKELIMAALDAYAVTSGNADALRLSCVIEESTAIVVARKSR